MLELQGTIGLKKFILIKFINQVLQKNWFWMLLNAKTAVTFQIGKIQQGNEQSFM